jgi:hypothetical protein
VPTESYLFSHGIQPFSERFQHANPTAPTMGRIFMPREAFLDAMRDLVDRVLLETLERQDANARYLVERTPWHASHLPLIADVYPDARVINIVRDGRAVGRSLVSMPWGPATIDEAATEWRKSVEDARRGGVALGDRYREILYERLLEEPRARTSELLEWLGLELSDETWDRILAEAGAEFNVDPGSPGVRTDKWRDELSDADVRAFERVAGTHLEMFGYERAATDEEGPRSFRRLIAHDRARAGARLIRQPRSAARAARDRALARRLHADQIAHNETVADFERLVAERHLDDAKALLSARLSARVDAGGGPIESRGNRAIASLLHALDKHEARQMHVLSGHVHASPYGLTTIANYELGDGTRWIRTLVYGVRGGRIREVGLYRRQVHEGGSDTSAGG